MTTTFDGPALAQDSEIYDPDEGLFRNSPPMKLLRPKLNLSPSPPPAIPLPRVSLPSNPGRKRKSSNRRRKVPPSQGDAVLIQYMDGGKRPDIAFEAGSRPLASSLGEGGEEEEEEGDDEEGSYTSSSGESSDIEIDDEHTHSPAMSPESRPTIPPAIDLKSLAASALSAVQADEPRDVPEPRGREMVPQETFSSPNGDRSTSLRQKQRTPNPLPLRRETMSQAPKSVLAPPMSPYTSPATQDLYSPRQTSSQVLRHPSDAKSPTQLPTPSMHGDLPPIGSPQSEVNGHASLPPIRSQLVDQLSEPPPPA
ncbi:hypothetical protein PG988_006601 [Apiospora saccharicola]